MTCVYTAIVTTIIIITIAIFIENSKQISIQSITNMNRRVSCK